MYRRNQTESMFLIWIPVVVFSILLLSCGNLQELIGLKEEEDSLPKEVIESAKSFFELTHTILAAPDPALADKTGLDVYWEQENVKLVLQFNGFQPDPENPSVTLSGTVTITWKKQNPVTLTMSGSITVTNYTYKTIEINGDFGFSGSLAEKPSSVSGSYRTDGKSYDLKKVFDSIKWDEEEGAGGTPYVQTYPPSFWPAPSAVWNKVFYLCGSRPYSSTEYDTLSHRGEHLDFNSNGQECRLYIGAHNGRRVYVNCEAYPGFSCLYLYDVSDVTYISGFKMQYSTEYLYVCGIFYQEEVPTYYYFHINPQYMGPFPTDNF